MLIPIFWFINEATSSKDHTGKVAIAAALGLAKFQSHKNVPDAKKCWSNTFLPTKRTRIINHTNNSSSSLIFHNEAIVEETTFSGYLHDNSLQIDCQRRLCLFLRLCIYRVDSIIGRLCLQCLRACDYMYLLGLFSAQQQRGGRVWRRAWWHDATRKSTYHILV